MKRSIVIIFLSLASGPSHALFTDGINTNLLFSIVSNTGSQLVRMEELLKKSEDSLKYTNEIKNATQTLQDKYDLLSEIEDTLIRVSSIPSASVEELRDVNDLIEDVQDKRSRMKDLLDEAKKNSKKDNVIAEAINTSREDIVKEDGLNKEQLKKTKGMLASKNQNQVTAQNTALINMKLSKTNLLLEKLTISQMNSNKLQADELKTKYSDQEGLNNFLMGKDKSPRKVK